MTKKQKIKESNDCRFELNASSSFVIRKKNIDLSYT